MRIQQALILLMAFAGSLNDHVVAKDGRALNRIDGQDCKDRG